MSADSTTDNVLALIAEIIASYNRQKVEDTAILEEIQHALKLLSTQPLLRGEFVPSRHPIINYADSVLAYRNAATANLVAAIRPVIDFLPWRYSYSKRADAPDLGDRIAFAEIIGPDAPFPSHSVCLGLTLIGPGTLYPAHKHPAVELYHVVSGTAEWTAGSITRLQPPGAFIVHPSNIVHAMRTHEEALLAIYTWTGKDVVTTSVYVPESTGHTTKKL